MEGQGHLQRDGEWEGGDTLSGWPALGILSLTHML